MASDNIDADICEIIADPERDASHEHIGAAKCRHCGTVFTYKYSYKGYEPCLESIVENCPNCNFSTKFYGHEITKTHFKFARWWRSIKNKFRKD